MVAGKRMIMDTPTSLVLGNVALPSGRIADISLGDGKVVHIGSYQGSVEYIDCTGLLVLPAAVDMHVHMRGGSQSEKEDWKSGSRSALAGGVTVVVDQPNTLPPITTPSLLKERVSDALNNTRCNFAINSGVTPGTNIVSMWETGAMAFGEIFFAPSSYGECISNTELSLALKNIRSIRGLATIHAETIDDIADRDLAAHDRARSAEGELLAVKAIRRLNATGCRLHFCHLSSERSTSAAAGSVEVTPHHLFLSLEDFEKNDPLAKVNPPLRTQKERKQLLGHWDRIDVIASDHAPHSLTDKGEDFSCAPSGIPGVETLMPLLLAGVMDGKISLQSVIQKTSRKPAELLGIPCAGFKKGDRGDFALYSKIQRPIRAEMLHSKCGWTPFEGHMGIFPHAVIMNGKLAYRDGEFFPSEPRWFYGEGYQEGTIDSWQF